MSIELVMPSNHLILFHPLLLLPSIFPSIRVFSNEKGRIVDIKSEFKCLLLFSTTRINFPLAMCVFGHVHMFLCKNIYLFEPPYTSKAYEKLNFPGKKTWQPTPVFLLENSMDRGAWWATLHGVAKSQTDTTVRLNKLFCKKFTYSYHI